MFRFAVNTQGKNKDWDMTVLTKGFKDQSGTLQDVINHVKQGHALCAGLLSEKWRKKENFKGSQWILCDIDNSGEDANGKKGYLHQLTLDEALQHPFIQQYCSLIYTSASHTPEWHRYRLVWRLPTLITNIELYEEVVRLLLEQMPHDPSCKDGVRVFYGNTAAEFPLVNESACIPQEWIDEAEIRLADLKVERAERDRLRTMKKQSFNKLAVKEQWDTDELIRQALNVIPPRDPGSGNYDECFRVLAALTSYYSADETAIIAEAWSPSLRGTTWNVDKKIASMRRSEGVGIGTLFHIAGQYGFKFPEQRKEPSQRVSPVTVKKTPVTAAKPIADKDSNRSKPPVTLDPLSSENEDFQQLVEYGRQSLDLFEIYPQPLAELLTAKAKSLPVAPEAVHQTFMAIVSGIVGARSRVFIDKGWKEPMVFFTGFVAPAGSKKSPAMDVARDPLVQLQSTAHAIHQAKDEEYQSEKRRYDLLKKEEKGDTPPPIAPHMRHYYLEDTTLEAVISTHAQEINANGFTLIYDELAEMFDGMDQYRSGKGNDRKKILRLFGGKDLKTDRKTEGSSSFIPKSSVSITGGIQESTLIRLISSSKDDDGLWDRFLWCFPRFVSVRERGKPVDITDYLKGLFREFDSLPEQDYWLSPAARKALLEFEYWAEDQRHEVSQGIFQAYMKLIGYVPRLSLFLHITEAVVTKKSVSTTISYETVLKAIKLINFYATQIHVLHSKATDNTVESQLLKVINLSQEKGSISTRDIQRKRITKTADEAAKTLEALIDKGIGKVTKGDRGQTLWEYQTESGIPHLRLFIPSDATDQKTNSNQDGERVLDDFIDVTEETIENNGHSTNTTGHPASPVPLQSGELWEAGSRSDAGLHSNGNGSTAAQNGTGSDRVAAVPPEPPGTSGEGSNGHSRGTGQDTSTQREPAKEVRAGTVSVAEGGNQEQAEETRQDDSAEARESVKPIREWVRVGARCRYTPPTKGNDISQQVGDAVLTVIEICSKWTVICEWHGGVLPPIGIGSLTPADDVFSEK